MKPLIETPEELAALLAEADSWVGTRYAGDGAVKGTGASCAMLPWSILHNVGHRAPLPPSRAGLFKRDLMPAMETWLDGNPEHFLPIPECGDAVLPGDVLFFNAGTGHLALALSFTEIIHSYQSSGVTKTTRTNKKISDRLIGVWRPLK
jgi:cell wall-associated NlpC family hydrolase